MSVPNKVVAAAMPLESEDARRKARTKARTAAEGGDWLAQILDHHEQIETAFEAVKVADDVTTRRAAQMELARLLLAHANAEEAVIYPALIFFGRTTHGNVGYSEQASVKADLGELEYLDPLSQEFMDKLEHIRGAVAQHVYEEENDRFLDLKLLPAAEQGHLTRRYVEEFARYAGGEMDAALARTNEIYSEHLTRSRTQ